MVIYFDQISTGSTSQEGSNLDTNIYDDLSNLQTNKIYYANISQNTSFSLPTNVDTSILNQIKIYANFSSAVSVTWGTTQFYNNTIPTIEAGMYEIFFDYFAFEGWTCGALKLGNVS